MTIRRSLGALRDRFGSKRTFNVHLQTLVNQGIINQYGRMGLPDGRWVTVTRGPNVKYSFNKTSPLSPEAPIERVAERIEENLRKSNLALLTAVELFPDGDRGWKGCMDYPRRQLD